MKHRFVILSMILLLIFAVVLPAAAQDDTSETPPVCSADDLKQVVAQVSQISDQLSAASVISQDANDAGALIQSLLAWSDAYQSYFSDIYPNYPACADGILMSDALGLLVSQQLSLSSMAPLSVLQTNANSADADVTAALNDLATIQGTIIQNTASGFTTYLTSLKSGQGLPSWLPACIEAQMKVGDQLDEMEATYDDLKPNLQAYLDDGTVDKDTYIASAKLVDDISNILNTGGSSCVELYSRTIGDYYTFVDTFIALTDGQILPFLEEDADIEAFTPVKDYFDGTLGTYVMPTEEASS